MLRLDKDYSDTGPIKGLYLKNTRSTYCTVPYGTVAVTQYSTVPYRTILHGIIRETATSANKKDRSEQKGSSGVNGRWYSVTFK